MKMKINLLKLKLLEVLTLILGLSLLTFTSYRAYNLSFTHDESLSYQWYSDESIFSIFSNKGMNFLSPNNHTLNTLYLKFIKNVFGPNEFLLRSHSLLAHIVYLISTYLISRMFLRQIISIVFFFLINVNLYLLDFFSLARGYALSIGCMIASYYFLCIFMRSKDILILQLTLFFSILASLANLPLLLYSLAVALIIEISIVQTNSISKFWLTNLKISWYYIAILLIYFFTYSSLKEAELFDFAGEIGIWNDTIKSSINCYLYIDKTPLCLSYLLMICVIFTFITQFMRSIIEIYKGSNNLNLAFLILVIICSVMLLLNVLGLSGFLIERFALFLYPLFIISFLDILNYLYDLRVKISNYFCTTACVSTLLGATYIFAKGANLSHTKNWEYDANTKQMLNDLAFFAKEDQKPITLGVNWLFEPTINYYRETRNLTWLQEVRRVDSNDSIFKYYYLLNDHSEGIEVQQEKSYLPSKSRLIEAK